MFWIYLKSFRVFEYCTCINYHMDKVLKVSFGPAREKCSKWNAFWKSFLWCLNDWKYKFAKINPLKN